MLINIFNASVSAVWLILAVAVLRLLLKRAPKWITCLLWTLVGLRLVMPFSIESMFSLIPSAKTVPQTIAYDPVPQINSGVPAVNNAVNPVLSDYFAAVPENSANPMQILLGLGELLWVAGMIAMVLYLVISYVALRLKMRTATRMRDNIMQSERVASPFVMGIIRPVIYLPYNMDESAQEYVIAHEQAHIRRGDHIVKPVAFLVLTLHWFNPFVWLAYVLLCRDIELACDQRVVRDMSAADRKDYSRALVNVNSSRRTASACPLAFSEVGVKERVKSVLSYKKPALWIIVAAVVVCAVTALCFLTDPMKKHDPFGKSYRVKEVIYLTSLSYNEDYQPKGDFGEWVLTEDHRLTDAEIFFTQGRFEEINLTKENFDDLCVEVDVPNGRWPKGLSPARLRGENQSAWKLQDINSPGRFGLLLQQKNGDVYLAEGSKIENYEGPYSTFIRSVVLIEEVTTGTATDLDAALNKAALDENKGGYFSGQFRCAAHTILATESEVVDENTTRLTAYAIMLYQEYSLNNGIPEDVSGSSCPVAVTFDITAAGEYTLVEYWEPMDGSMYPESLREKFPDGVSWNTQLGHKERNESCYRQACEYFGVDPVAVTTDSPQTVPTTTTAVQIGNAAQSAAWEREYELPGDDEYGVIVLRADGRFRMVLGTENATELNGYYSEAEGGLVLVADDRSCEAVFAVSEGALFFDAQASQGVSAVGILTDGAVFYQKYGYMCLSEHSMFGPSTLTLRADGQASLYFGYLSSYFAFGQFSFDGERLTILTTDGLNNCYVFEKYGESFVFRAEGSSPIPMFKPSADAEPEAVFEDGAVFDRV